MLPTYLLFLEFSRFFSRLETENRIILISRLETKTENWIILVSRPRRDREFCKMISRDRDDTETRNLDREIREIETETRVSSNPGQDLLSTDHQSTKLFFFFCNDWCFYDAIAMVFSVCFLSLMYTSEVTFQHFMIIVLFSEAFMLASLLELIS